MVTEPRTSPTKTKHQIIFGVAAWVLGIIYSMFILNPFHAFSLGFLSANGLKIVLEKLIFNFLFLHHWCRLKHT